jgi:hypothetical protein
VVIRKPNIKICECHKENQRAEKDNEKRFERFKTMKTFKTEAFHEERE